MIYKKHSWTKCSLTDENKQDLERIQKSACKIILKNKNIEYERALQFLNLDNLNDRRETLCQRFANKSAINETIIFEPNIKSHQMEARNSEIYQVTHCKTERLKKSAIPHMQRMLNQSEMK